MSTVITADPPSPAALPRDRARYSRQVLLPQVGAEGQRRLADATVLVVGCGALGGGVANLLARAGVGHLIVTDRDYVERSNLQRQTLFDEADVDQHLPKAAAAAARLRQINHEIEVTPIVTDVNADTVVALAAGAEIIVDGTDNFETRYLLNDLAVKHGRPWVYGGVIGNYGMSLTIRPGVTPCLRCVFPEAPVPGSAPTCDTAGVYGPTVEAVAAIQTSEVIKLVVGDFPALNRDLLAIDLWQLTVDRVHVGERDPACPACGERRFAYLERPAGSRSAVLCGHDAVQVRPDREVSMDFPLIAGRLALIGDLLTNPYLLRFQPHDEPYAVTLFLDGRAIIKGTDDPDVARAIYARFIGL